MLPRGNLVTRTIEIEQGRSSERRARLRPKHSRTRRMSGARRYARRDVYTIVASTRLRAYGQQKRYIQSTKSVSSRPKLTLYHLSGSRISFTFLCTTLSNLVSLVIPPWCLHESVVPRSFRGVSQRLFRFLVVLVLLHNKLERML